MHLGNAKSKLCDVSVVACLVVDGGGVSCCWCAQKSYWQILAMPNGSFPSETPPARPGSGMIA